MSNNFYDFKDFAFSFTWTSQPPALVSQFYNVGEWKSHKTALRQFYDFFVLKNFIEENLLEICLLEFFRRFLFCGQLHVGKCR